MNKYILSRKSSEIGYLSFVWPIVEYGNVIYDLCPKADSDKLENVQLKAAWIATCCKATLAISNFILNFVGWNYLTAEKATNWKKLYCITTFNTPQYLIDILEEMKTYHSHPTRTASTHIIPMPKCKKEVTEKYLFPSTIRSWNSLNSQWCEAHTKSQFSTLINKKHVWLQEKNYFYTVFLVRLYSLLAMLVWSQYFLLETISIWSTD